MTRFTLRRCGAVTAMGAALLLASAGPAFSAREKLTWEEQQVILKPVAEWAAEFGKEKNADGAKMKKVSYSRTPTKLDDERYSLTAHVNTAHEKHQETERYLVTLKKTDGKWAIENKEIKDTYVGLYRDLRFVCQPFETFNFEREGMHLQAKNGTVCMNLFREGVESFTVEGEGLQHKYTPPPHAQRVLTGHDFYAMHREFTAKHQKQLDYEAKYFNVSCDVDTCAELIEETFTGLTPFDPATVPESDGTEDVSALPKWLQDSIKETKKNLKEDAFRYYRVLDREESERYFVFVSASPAEADNNYGTWLSYNKWGGWEVRFGVSVKRWDQPDQLRGSIYGYFTEETLENSTPVELERRDDTDSIWFEVEAVDGVISLATETPETLLGDVEYTLRLKRPVKELPFLILSDLRNLNSGDDPKPIVVNSITVDDKELTWVQTGPLGGRVVLEEELPADSRIKVRMDWRSETLLKMSHSYSYIPRGGWMPFVSFGDVIDEFKLEIRAPDDYQVIGIGFEENESVKDGIRTALWRADHPVNFPTIIFGRYEAASPGFDAKKLDGTVIPIKVHVDKASFADWDIRGNQLKPIAEQAANAINVYSNVSGVDYPFRGLNLVNDPLGFLYGQAPSSIIYLGSGVFRGEGLSQFFLDAAGINRFLRSVVAHEVGHQWWGNKIANANSRNYWFVESLAEYFSAIFLEAVFGYDEYMGQVEEWRRNILNSKLKGSVQNADTLFPGEGGGDRTAAIYNKGPYGFHMLRETFKGEGPRGPDGADKKFFEFLKSFCQELAEKREIVTLDIQRAAERGLGGVDENGEPYNVDLDWFFNQWIRGSGIPKYNVNYDIRQAEDGGWIIDGVILQTVLLSNSDVEIDDTVYRGVVDVKVEAKGGPFLRRVIINDKETPIRLKVPAKPRAVTVNADGEMLALETEYNKG